MTKMCRRIPAINEDNRKAWLEKQNTLIKYKLVTPEPSLMGSSLLSHNISLKSLSDIPGSTARYFKTKPTPSQILYERLKPDMTEEDKKILGLMALRREAAIKEEEMAHSIRNMWAEEKKLYEKTVEDKKKRWNEYIAEKRKMENLENCWRKKNQIEMLKEEKILLESRINEKHQRNERRRKEITTRKRIKPEQNSARYEALHQQLKLQQEWEENMKNALKLKYYEERCRRAEEKLQLISEERFRRIKESSLKRDLKWEAAREVREEMERKSEEIQRENIKREEMSQTIRENRVINAIEWKRKMALEKNQMKKHYHEFVYNKLKDEEQERESQARRYLQAKETRMKALKEKKDMAIAKSRSNSRMAANLREIIKSSYGF